MREVLLIRHGITAYNQQRVFTGATDIPLCPEGMAALSARRARYPKADAFFTSGMLRTAQSLAAVYGEVPYTEIAELAEYNFGAFEGRTHDDLFLAEPIYRQWLEASQDDLACPGGESRAAFGARIWHGWQAILAAEWQGLAAAFVHGGVIARLRDALEGGGPHHAPENGAGCRVTVDEDGRTVRVEAFS